MANTGQATSGGGNDNVVFSPTFLLPAAFPGIELNRHQVTNLINAGFAQVPVQQQPQQQHQLVAQTGVKTETNRKGRNNQQQQQQNQQQQMLQQQMGTQLMAVAFPGQHSGSGQQQQQLGHQQQHQLIAAAPTRNNVTYSVNSTVWACPACKLSFKSAAELQTHLSSHTKSEKSVPCQTCGKLFASAERVRIHIRVAHGEKSCACDICGSGFSYRCKLMDHMRTHTGDKPFRCDSCGRSFSQKNHLRRHQMIHTGERPFPCEVCGRGFYRKDKLNRHRRIHQNPGAGGNTAATTTGGGGRKAKAAAANANHSNNNSSNANANNVTANAFVGQQLTVAASTPDGQGQTIQLVPLNVGQFQGANLAALGNATQQWIISQQRQMGTGNSNNTSTTTSNNASNAAGAANGTNSSSSTTPTPSTSQS